MAINKLYETEIHQVSLQTECKHVMNAHYGPFHQPIQLIYQGLFLFTGLLECKPQTIHLRLQNISDAVSFRFVFFNLVTSRCYRGRTEAQERKLLFP